MEKIVRLFSVLLLSSLVGVNSLQCYTCFKCTTLSADDLRTCGEPVTTTLAPTVPSTTGIPSSPSTTTPSSTTPSSTTPSSTTPSSTNPSSTTPSSTAPSTTTPSTATPSTTTSSTTTTTTTTSITEAPVSPELVYPPAAGPEPEGRSKRNVMSVSTVSKFEDIEYVCYKVTALMNNETVIERGCAPAVVDNKELCDHDVIKNVTTSCTTCKTDKCNGSYAVQFSSVLLVAAMVGLLFCE